MPGHMARGWLPNNTYISIYTPLLPGCSSYSVCITNTARLAWSCYVVPCTHPPTAFHSLNIHLQGPVRLMNSLKLYLSYTQSAPLELPTLLPCQTNEQLLCCNKLSVVVLKVRYPAVSYAIGFIIGEVYSNDFTTANCQRPYQSILSPAAGVHYLLSTSRPIPREGNGMRTYTLLSHRMGIN